MSAVAASTEPPTASSDRDDFIDLCRAFSLLIVVVWHWVFTIVVWRQDGPSATSPLGFTDNLWLLTWLLQVMPVFFFVGGHAHLQLWTKPCGGPPTGASCSGGCGGSWSRRWPCFWCGRCATNLATSTGGSPTGHGRSRGALSEAGCSA